MECEELRRQSSLHSRDRGYYLKRVVMGDRRKLLTGGITVLFPLFPLIYFLKMFNFIDNDTAFVSFLIASAFAKTFYAILCTDAYLEVSHPAMSLIRAEEYAKISRRALLRYFFHEVRGPLNAISLAADMLSHEGDEKDDDTHSSKISSSTVAAQRAERAELVSAIRCASASVEETLNDALTLQRIETKTMWVLMEHFSVRDKLRRIQTAAQCAVAKTCGITVTTVVEAEVPAVLMGDKHKIHHVLTHLVINAIRFSPDGGNVVITAHVEVQKKSPLPTSRAVCDGGSVAILATAAAAAGHDNVINLAQMVKGHRRRTGAGDGVLHGHRQRCGHRHIAAGDQQNGRVRRLLGAAPQQHFRAAGRPGRRRLWYGPRCL